MAERPVVFCFGSSFVLFRKKFHGSRILETNNILRRVLLAIEVNDSLNVS